MSEGNAMPVGTTAAIIAVSVAVLGTGVVGEA